MMNKKGMLPRNWIVLVVIIGMLIASTSYWINSWESKYSPIEPSNLSQSYNAISEVAESTNTLEGKLGEKTQTSTLGYFDFVVQGAYNVLVSVISVPIIIKNFVYDAGAEFGVPRIFVDGFIILISIGAIFGIVGAIFRKKV